MIEIEPITRTPDFTGMQVAVQPTALFPPDSPVRTITASGPLQKNIASLDDALAAAAKLTEGSKPGAVITAIQSFPLTYDIYSVEIAEPGATEGTPFHFEGADKLRGAAYPQLTLRPAVALVDGETTFRRT